MSTADVKKSSRKEETESMKKSLNCLKTPSKGSVTEVVNTEESFSDSYTGFSHADCVDAEKNVTNAKNENKKVSNKDIDSKKTSHDDSVTKLLDSSIELDGSVVDDLLLTTPISLLYKDVTAETDLQQKFLRTKRVIEIVDKSRLILNFIKSFQNDIIEKLSIQELYFFSNFTQYYSLKQNEIQEEDNFENEENKEYSRQLNFSENTSDSHKSPVNASNRRFARDFVVHFANFLQNLFSMARFNIENGISLTAYDPLDEFYRINNNDSNLEFLQSIGTKYGSYNYSMIFEINEKVLGIPIRLEFLTIHTAKSAWSDQYFVYKFRKDLNELKDKDDNEKTSLDLTYFTQKTPAEQEIALNRLTNILRASIYDTYNDVFLHKNPKKFDKENYTDSKDVTTMIYWPDEESTKGRRFSEIDRIEFFLIFSPQSNVLTTSTSEDKCMYSIYAGFLKSKKENKKSVGRDLYD